MELREFINRLTSEQIEEGNRKQLEENIRIYKEFKEAYNQGTCSLCSKPLNYFNEQTPCFHWFLKPDGIRKKHFENYLSNPIGFFQFDSYIRWMANLDAAFRNINDLKSEMNPSKLVEYTVKYKNIEWSISIGQTDRHGHSDSANAAFPHFHIQMVVDGQIFLKFNDFHIPLSDNDIFMFRLMEEAPDKFVWKNTYGEGMSIIEDEELLLELDQIMVRSDDVENGMFNTSTLVEMPEGETIDGEMLQKLFKESRETGTPVRHLIKKYYPTAKTVTEITPGNGVPTIKKRKKRK